MMEKSENDQSDIHLEDFPHICRICLKNGELRSFEGEDYLLDQFRIITNIDVHSTVHYPRNICKECISRLEDISLFIEFSKCSDGMLRKNLENHEEVIECGKDVKTVCRICLSQSNLMPFEVTTHLMEVFQSITNIDVKPKINFEQTICKTCSDKLEEISVFISSSLSNNKKLEDVLVLNRPIKIEKEMNDDGSTRFCKINYESIFDEREIKNPDIDIKQEDLDYELAASGSEFCSQDTEENPTVQDQFKCESCEKCFTRKKYLQQHLLTHEPGQRFKCDSCDKTFHWKYNLERHSVTHTRERLFQCHICNKSLSRQTTLQLHLLTHIGDKPFQCNLCEKRFALKHHVERHLLTHTGETKKPFKCDSCESRFTGKALLQRHLLTHSGEKPLRCDLCERRFIGQNDLNRHLFTHSGEKPFKCEFCDKRFTFKLTMKGHVLTHSGEKPFACDLCEKRFTLNYQLQRHMNTHAKKNVHTTSNMAQKKVKV
nr:zinc finger protein 845-like [Leptinotarsa decemlineata]